MALTEDRTADVTIVGAGFAGLSAARRLHQIDPGLRIAVLDAGRVGEGAAGRNSGFMIDLPHDLQSDDYAGHAADNDRIMTGFNRAAIAFAAQAVADYGIDPAYFDPVGKVNGAAGDGAHAQNLSYARHLEALGEPCEMLDAQAMQELTGSSYYRSGLYTPAPPSCNRRAISGGSPPVSPRAAWRSMRKAPSPIWPAMALTGR